MTVMVGMIMRSIVGVVVDMTVMVGMIMRSIAGVVVGMTVMVGMIMRKIVGMVMGIHGYSPDLGPFTEPAVASGFS